MPPSRPNVAVVLLCVDDCAPSVLLTALRQLTYRAAGAWSGSTFVLTDPAHHAAVTALPLGAAQCLVLPRAARPLAALLRMSELQQFQTLLALDGNEMAVGPISGLLRDAAPSLRVADVALVESDGPMVIQRSERAMRCLDEWRHRKQSVSPACAPARLPAVSLHWSWRLQQKQLPLGSLLYEPSAEGQLLGKYAHWQRAPALYFVRFNRREREADQPSPRWAWVTKDSRSDASKNGPSYASAVHRSAVPEGPTSGWWLRYAAASGARAGTVLHLAEPRRNHDCLMQVGEQGESVTTLLTGRYAESVELITLGGRDAESGSPLTALGTQAVHEPGAPPHVLAAQFRLNAGGAHPLGERLLDVNHAMHVSLPPVDGGPGREWWLICGFYDPNVGREQSIRHAVVINASTLRPRLGPAMPTGSGACSALPIHADGYAKPALPCGFGGTDGNHDTGRFLDTVRCYDRVAQRWRAVFPRLPVAFDHGNALLMPAAACEPGGAARVLILNTRSTHYENLGSGRRSEVFAHDLTADGRPAAGGWYVYANDTSPSHTTQSRDAASAVLSPDGKWLLNFGGVFYHTEPARKTDVSGLFEHSSGVGAYSYELVRPSHGSSACRRSSPCRGTVQHAVTTSEIRALDLCGTRRWLPVGSMRRVRSAIQPCVLPTAADGEQHVIHCGGTTTRYWPPVYPHGRGIGGGADTQNMDTCEVHSITKLAESARQRSTGLASRDIVAPSQTAATAAERMTIHRRAAAYKRCVPADVLPPHPPEFAGTTLDLVTKCHLDPSSCEHVRRNRQLAAERLSACPALHAISLEVEPSWWACARDVVGGPLAKLRVLRGIVHERHTSRPAHVSAFVMWLDADALYLLPSLQLSCLPAGTHVSLSHWLPSDPSIHLVASRDSPREPFILNTGAMVIRASPWSKNVFDKLLAASKGPLMHITKRRGALHYPDCAAQGGAWPCKLAMKWYRLPANRNSSARGFDCCWPEQGRVNNFFLKRERGGGQENPMLNVRILPESILDARVGSRTNASRMLVVHNAGCTKGGRSAESCAAALYASATQLGLERVSAFGF